jgi:uncharacterized membrane protein YhaH (DUF805 family)
MRLTDFTGRESRSEFWPYVGAVMGGMFLMWIIAFSVAGGSMVAGRGLNPGILPLAALFLALAVIGLLAAAVARRLRDAGASRLWGLLPLPFLAFGFVGMAMMESSMADGQSPPPSMFFAVFINNMIYLVALAMLIVKLVKKADTPAD